MATSRLPTTMQLEEGRAILREQQKQVDEVQRKIEDAQRALEELITESTRAISALEADKRKAESEIQATKEFLSPMRRLPDDLLQHIFCSNFEDSPCCAWTLAGVCSSWRRIALNMPRLWSKIRLVTTLNSSPDTARLWLERSGNRVPLDIEIYLHIPAPPKKRRRAITPIPAAYSPPPITDFFFHPPPPTPPTYAVPPPPLPMNTVSLGMQNAIPHLAPPSTAHIHPVYIDPVSHWRSRQSNKNQSPTSSSWGHIVLFYLAEQMHRWKRFVFRFDRQFDSVSALRNIARDAPLLEEFEVSCGEPLRSEADVYPYDWQWLPSTDREVQLPNIRSVSLQYVPFRWSSPLIAGNLRTINIRSLSTPGIGGHTSTQMTLDRLLHIISSNPTLEHLSLHFQNAQPAVLPLETTRLNELKSLSIGGSFTLTPLLDALVTPSLESLTLNIDREAPEESISALLARSNSPPISFLSLAYQSQLGMGPYYGDAPPGLLPWGFLASLPHIKTLQVGHTALDVLVDALSHVEDEAGSWLAPELEHLALRSCHAHGDSVSKLVALVEARNPPFPGSTSTLVNSTGPSAANSSQANGIGSNIPGLSGPFTGGMSLSNIVLFSPPPNPVTASIGGAGHPARLKTLELYDCAILGDDILRWLRSRISDVKCTEPTMSRGLPRSPTYYPVDL
ncbi:uncharacterized protein FOMMEDRAFT_118794 [Fomitiporia mediterranea MF3/22]|uniref:uncharacterized protein n=1 Tax=Fomitiporia mediterranea (strain MF3/22) TaxID=694068 RepID=UPI0004409625|nr:uncharacterized protein FOMMEDRAFT_118794 [Fomitiporia mediterranea MF3/22]EJD05622.1 hypothetical protein FOMMEDRAFT_118794 [Fomitiporia mediterranea MF3/22]